MITAEQATARRRLTKALRSGKYKQGQLMLRNKRTNEFCCQGVQCDLVDPGAWVIVEDSNYVDYRVPGLCCTWPDDVREALGLSKYASELLMGMNDKRGEETHSFDDIADTIDLLTLADEQPSATYTAWIEIARRFAEGEAHSDGLCWECDEMADERLISFLQMHKMHAAIGGYLKPGQVYAYTRISGLWGCAKEDEARCLAAIWLALEAEDEADRLADEVPVE